MKTALMCIVSALLLGCAGVPAAPLHAVPADAFAALVAQSPIGVAPDVDVLALPPEADALLADALAGATTPLQKVQALSTLFGAEGRLVMHYDSLTTGTAAETFAQRTGSCLAFTNLFIALARRAGVDAHYREIVTVPQWDKVGDYVMRSRHVAAYGEIPRYGSYTTDFGVLADERVEFGRVISDDRARAQYFNNRGAWWLAHADGEAAVREFNRALTIDRSLAYVWTNVGTAYIRLARYGEAEIALQHALRLEPWDVTPLNQLARLYEAQGRTDLARQYVDRAGAARLRDPYVLYQEGVDARGSGDIERAIGLLQRAVRVKPDEPRFLIELGATYRAAGRLDRARKAFAQANGLVTNLEDRNALIDALRDG